MVAANTSRTYLYAFRHPTGYEAYPRWTEGVHGDDLAYVFGAPLVQHQQGGGGITGSQGSGGGGGLSPFSTVYTRADRALSETVIKYWSNFIKTGFVNDKRTCTIVHCPLHTLPMRTTLDS